MNRLVVVIIAALIACAPMVTMAQVHGDAKYLAGAVPLVDGKVIFSKEFSAPGQSQQQIYDKMLGWLTQRLLRNDNDMSRVVYTDVATGSLAGVGEEWIVFKSSALSLDRTLINYQIAITCQPEKCLVEVMRIRFTYRETEKYAAEEWIVDEYAINKSKNTLVKGLAKWRTKTVDFMDRIFLEAAAVLRVAPVNAPPTGSTPSVASAPVAPAAGNMAGYTEVAPDKLPASAIQMGAGKLVIAIGSDAFNMTMMTPNAGGSLGKSDGKAVVFTMLTPDQPYQQLDNAKDYTVRFYPTGQNEASVVLECRKLPAQAPMEGQPRMYIGQIIKAWTK